MFNWIDRVYKNARKRVFKNLDTGEILNLELQDDPSNVSKESPTPLTAHCLNLAQQELVDDMSKIYMGMNITADTVAGLDRINKTYGKITEVGTGEKSPDNQYMLKCVGDDVNLYNKATEAVGKAINASGVEQTLSNWTHGDYITVNSKEAITLSCENKVNGQFMITEYNSSKTYVKTNAYDFRNTSADNKYTITTGDTTAYIIAQHRNDLSMGNIKVQKGSVATPYSPYGYGTVENISKNGSNTSSNIAYVNKPLCSVGNVRDELDYIKGKITRRLAYEVFDGSDDENWILATGDTISSRKSFYIMKANNGLTNCSHFNIEALNNIANVGEYIAASTVALQIGIKNERLSTPDVPGLKAYLKSNPITVVYELATPTTEAIDCTDKIAQYDGQTTVYNRDNAEIEVSLTNNKAISEINENIKQIEEKINSSNRTMLWKNPSINSSFGYTAQINLLNDDYDELEIYCLSSTSASANIVYQKTIKGRGCMMQLIDMYTRKLYSRSFTRTNDTAFAVSECYQWGEGLSGVSADNTKLIPLYIIGIKD